ncbi:MAG: hypothetical protein J7502_20180 [Flavisolibacter sp.]|nr:hypothetical protein [Flavisolibacter sp.]
MDDCVVSRITTIIVRCVTHCNVLESIQHCGSVITKSKLSLLEESGASPDSYRDQHDKQ